MPAECSPPSSVPPETSAPPDESSIPSESSVPSSEPEPQPSTTTDECEAAGSEPTGDGSTGPLPGEIADGDLAIAAVAASIEVLAVNTYTIAREAATGGTFGDVPPAVARYVETALSHHQAALEAWNGVLLAAARPAVTRAPVNLAISLNEQFGAAASAIGAARVTLSLEQLAAATYLDALGKLVSAPAVSLAGSILAIDRQHVAVLLFALGRYPVPESFATAELAYVPTEA